MMSFLTCCVPGCSDTKSKGVLHRFPNPNNDKERFRQWVKNVGGPITQLEDLFIYTNRRVCRKHFEGNFCYPKNRLCHLSVPTLYLPGLSLEGEESVQRHIAEPVHPILGTITNFKQIVTRMNIVPTPSSVKAPVKDAVLLTPITAAPDTKIQSKPITKKLGITKKESEPQKTILKLKSKFKLLLELFG